jgi:hypothetical protein
METTAYHYKKLRDLEDMAEHNGLKLKVGPHDWISSGNVLSLVTHEEHLPIYTRDIALASGTAEELHTFLRGWHSAREYLFILGATSKKAIARKEQNYRNRDLTNMIKKGKRLNDE